MRHRKSGKRLGRTWEHRKSLFRNLSRSLLTYGKIRTTEAKAKELRKVVDRLITLALRNDLHARRQAYKVLENHALVKKLFDEIGPRFVGVKGGYTRVVKLGLPRPGDCAPLAIIEFTRGVHDEDEPEAKESKPKAEAAKEAPAKKKTKAKKAAEETPAEETPAEEAPAEEPAAEEAPAEEAPAEEPAAEEAPAEEAPAEEAPAEEAPAEEAAEEPKKEGEDA